MDQTKQIEDGLGAKRMKRLDEMTHDDLIQLTKEDKENLINLEAAHEGVKIPGPEPVAPTRPDIPFDAKLWKVADICFDDEECALKLAAFLAENISHIKKADYDYGLSSDVKYVSRLDSWDLDRKANVEVINCVSHSTYLLYKTALNEYKTLKTRYDAEQKHWKEETDAIKYITERVNEAIEEAWCNHHNLEKHKAIWEQYLELAGGEIVTARNFYFKAHSPSEFVRERLESEMVLERERQD